MREVIEEDCSVRRGKIDLVDPIVFTSRLPFNEPTVMEELPAFNEGVEMEPLRQALVGNPAVDARRSLFFGRSFVIPKIVRAVTTKDHRERQRRCLVKRVPIHP
jgi:hypothetical protein